MTQQTKVLLKKGTLQIIRRIVPIRQDIAYSFCFTGAETEIHKIKGGAKLREKQTSIAAVRAKLGQFDIFQTPLLSGCRLPLKPKSQNRCTLVYTSNYTGLFL
jgi:hypothetical protein